MAKSEGSKRAQEATLSARPSDPRLREAQRLHHEERQFQRQADEANKQRGEAASEVKDLTIAKASREAEIDQLNKAIDDTSRKLYEARDRAKAMELEAISVEKSNPHKAADIREAAAAIRAEIPELERFSGTHKSKLQEAWDEVKDMEVRLETRGAEVARLSEVSERLRNLAEEREASAEALEQQRAAEPVRPDVPEIEIFELDRLRTALREGHRVVLGEDGHIRVWEERGRPMTEEQIDYLESKLPELRHRLGEGWNFTIETDGTIGGNGPWGANYFASPTGQISEQTLAVVRSRVGDGYDVSIAPDGTVVTSQATTAVSPEQARQNLESLNRELASGALTERMASGQGYDLNPDGTGGYSAIAPMTAPASPDPAPGTRDDTDPQVDPRDPMPPEDHPADVSETSMAPEIHDGSPESGTGVGAAQSDEDPTGEREVEGMDRSNQDGLEGADASSDTTERDDVKRFGQDDQSGEAQETSGADAGVDPDAGTYQDPYEDQTSSTPEPVPTYADSQSTESYDSYDAGPEDSTV